MLKFLFQSNISVHPESCKWSYGKLVICLSGPMQRLYYRRDRHCFFLNWLVVVDSLGNIVLSRPGFIGHVPDAVCLQ